MHLHKAKFLLFSIFLLQAHAHATHNPTGNSPTFNNNPTISPHIPITVNPTFTTNTTSTINAVGVQMRDFAITIQQKIKETFTKDNYNNAKDLLKTLLWQYRYKIAAGTVLGAYGTTTVILLNDYHYLTHPDRWGNWKSDCNFEMLCSIPHHELEQTLVRAIGEHHVNK
ncbi:MAG TPA: hypothetical protein VHX42_03130, partial [Candidatus Babeliales bacterium]|nr:hypothetical protein [Candidatus Babeliales bacterium]